MDAQQAQEVRRIVREEIRLAFKALAEGARANDWPYETAELDSRALDNIVKAAESAESKYTELCEKADEQRGRDAADPFKEPEHPEVDPDTGVETDVLADAAFGQHFNPFED